MTTPPTGTVTFLFTDIQGSTRLLQELGVERYTRVLDDHRRLLREAFRRHGGYETGTEGDAFFVAFSRAQDAIRAAADAQRALANHTWPEDRPVRVRMGLHTCEVAAHDGAYVGIGVHRVARICAAAHGGQVLLSQTTRDLIEDETGFGMLDLGDHRLKDLMRGQRLFQLLDPALPATFPPIRSLENRATNLPVQATPLVGRDLELAGIVELLRRDSVRLVTLTGPGGIGKTRLAVQAAAELVDEFPAGTFFVPLAAIDDPELVVPTIAQTIGVQEAAGQSLSAYMGTKELLLVLDNLEQVIAAAPRLAELLVAGRRIKLLATSREPLRLTAEHVHPVPPLELPDRRRAADPDELSHYGAVALFVDRARSVRPDFEVTAENATAVAEICRRVDGLPLALELAAARISLLSPEALLQRLGARLKLLTTGPRDLPSRQQTLRAALAWSYELLNEIERRLFARLGVFAGGFTFDAAEVLADADLDVLGSLVNKSLVRLDGERFTMLEVIREFALEQLASSGEEASIRERHAAFFEALAEQAYAERFAREGLWSAELEREHDNLRAALDWLSEVDARRCLRLATRLGWFWHVHSHFAEGRVRLAEALTAAPDQDEERARALAAMGELAAWQADVAAARPLIEEAVAIWRRVGQEQQVAFALYDLGWGYFFAGDDHAARTCMEESLRLQTKIGDSLLVNRARIGLLQILVSLGEIETVKPMAREALDVARRLGDIRAEHFAHHFLADCALIAEEYAAAEERYKLSLEAAWQTGDEVETCYELQGIAMSSAGQGHARRALRIAGAADAHLQALGAQASIGFWNALLSRHLGRAREHLGLEEVDAAWTEGRRLGLERALAEALAT
jgi:predicted ATPase/class 3 adenylate cyclase